MQIGAEIVRFLPLSLKMQSRLMVTVEFIDWKMAPDPHRVVFFLSDGVNGLDDRHR